MHRTFPASRALALVVGALALVATSFAGTAGATPPPRDGTIHQTLPIEGDTFPQESDCGSITEGTAWHFILNNTEVSTVGSTLTATFEDADGVTSTATATAEPTEGGATHYYVGTVDGLTLTGASVSTGDGQLQLSHVCDAPDSGDTGETDPELCPDGETEITDDTDADGNEVADMCESVEPELCPDGETEITDDTDADGNEVADMCESVEPELCPDGETEITDDTDADGNEVADMCESASEPDETTIAIECVDDEIVVTVTGQDLSNIVFYDAEDGVRGGQDTVFEYSDDGDAPLPEPTVADDGSEEFVVAIPDGAVRVSAKAGLEEEYADVDCVAEVIVDDDDDDVTVVCPVDTMPPADGELVDRDGNGVAENCTAVLDEEVVPDVPSENPVPTETPDVPVEDELPAPTEPEADVEGDEVVPATPAVPTVQPAVPASPTVLDSTPAVMGDVVTRSGQLPRTGAATNVLAPLGAALLAAGFALQRAGRRSAQPA